MYLQGIAVAQTAVAGHFLLAAVILVLVTLSYVMPWWRVRRLAAVHRTLRVPASGGVSGIGVAELGGGPSAWFFGVCGQARIEGDLTWTARNAASSGNSSTLDRSGTNTGSAGAIGPEASAPHPVE